MPNTRSAVAALLRLESWPQAATRRDRRRARDFKAPNPEAQQRSRIRPLLCWQSDHPDTWKPTSGAGKARAIRQTHKPASSSMVPSSGRHRALPGCFRSFALNLSQTGARNIPPISGYDYLSIRSEPDQAAPSGRILLFFLRHHPAATARTNVHVSLLAISAYNARPHRVPQAAAIAAWGTVVSSGCA